MAKYVLRVGFRIPYFELTVVILMFSLFAAGLYVGRHHTELAEYAKTILNKTKQVSTQATKSLL